MPRAAARRRARYSRWPGVILVLALVAIASILLVVLGPFASDETEEDTLLARYPELRQVDERICERVRNDLPKNALGSSSGSKRGALDHLLQALEGYEESGLGLLRVLVERDPGRRGSSFSTPYENDRDPRHGQPIATWLADRGLASLNPVLLRLVADRAVSYELRETAVIALCWDGNAEALAGLATVALAADADTTLRQAILFRLPRVGAPLSAHIGDLLFVPFHHLDECAAAAMALCGEPEAVSPIRCALRQTSMLLDSRHLFLAQAAVEISKRDPDIVLLAGRLSDPVSGTADSDKFRSAEWWQRHENTWEGRCQALSEAFDEYLTLHGELLATAFEVNRRAYLESDRRRREMALGRFEDILAADEAGIDLAAAALLLERTPDAERSRELEKLDRLASLLRRDIEGIDDPERIIAALNRRLVPHPEATIPHNWEEGPSTRLWCVLRDRVGNCLGLTLLYLAVAERLDLPIRAVETPEHVFVRWDDGTHRRNIELTAGGVEHPDDWYADRDDRLKIRPEDIEAGLFLVSMTKKQVLSRLLTNLSGAAVGYVSRRYAHVEGPIHPARYGRAHEHADRSVRLDSRNGLGYLSRARTLMLIEPGACDEALADVERAIDLRPLTYAGRVTAGRIHLAVNRIDEALDWFDRALELAPDDADARIGRIDCLHRLARHEQAAVEADAFLEKRPRHRVMRIKRLISWACLRNPAWRKGLADLIEDPVKWPGIHLNIASLLLQPIGDRSPDPESALSILDELRGLETETPVGALIAAIPDHLPKDENLLATQQRRYYDLRATALEALGRIEESRSIRDRLEAKETDDE
jgi:tetratricopeptide (TPR) repeat protein